MANNLENDLKNNLDKKCEFQEADNKWVYCLKNKKDCPYIESTIKLQLSKPIERETEFYLCSLNCNTWLYYPKEEGSGGN